MTDNETPTAEGQLASFRTERPKLANVTAPRMQMITGSDADREYQLQVGLGFALDHIDLLLQRVAELEQRLADRAD